MAPQGNEILYHSCLSTAMSNMSPSLSLVSCQIRVDFVLVGCLFALGRYWRDRISSHIDPLLREENYSHLPPWVEFVGYTSSQVHPDLLADPVYSVLERDEEGNIVKDRVIRGSSPDNATFWGYMSVFEMIDYLKSRNPYTKFSFFLRHIAAGQHDYCGPDWDFVRRGLIHRDVDLSTVLLDVCPIFAQLSSEIFMPPGELGGAVPPMVSAAHPAPSISSSNAIVTEWDFMSEPAHETRFPDDHPAPFFHHTGSDVRAQDLTMVPLSDPYRDLQASGSAAVPHLNQDNIFMPEGQEFAPVDRPASPLRGGVEQQHSTPRNYTKKIGYRDDLTNKNARPMLTGSSDEMGDKDWTGMLKLDDMSVFVRALMARKVGDPKLSNLPIELDVELAAGRKLSSLDIQGWIHKFKISMVQLSHINGMDNCDFDKLVEKIRAHGYAIVMWENRDRLLLAPIGKILLCAVFPEEGTTKRPTPQPPRKIRTLPRKEGPKNKKNKSLDKSLGPTHRKRRSPSVVGVTGHPGVQRRARQRPRSKRPQMRNAQDAMMSMQGEIDLSGKFHRMGSRNAI